MNTQSLVAIDTTTLPWEERFNEKLGRSLFRKNLITDPDTPPPVPEQCSDTTVASTGLAPLIPAAVARSPSLPEATVIWPTSTEPAAVAQPKDLRSNRVR